MSSIRVGSRAELGQVNPTGTALDTAFIGDDEWCWDPNSTADEDDEVVGTWPFGRWRLRGVFAEAPEADSLNAVLASELATVTGTEGKTARLRGVTTPGIGGGDVELVENSELEHDPVGGVFASGLPSHFFVRPDRTIRYEEEFLVHPTASANDNYEGLNRAAYECDQKRFKLMLRGGQYSVGGPLDFTAKNIFLEGAGRDSTTLRLTAAADAFVELDNWDYTFNIGHLTIDGGGVSQTAVKIGNMHGINSRLHDATIKSAQSKQLELVGPAVSSLFSSLHLQGGEYGFYCEEDNGLLSAATFHKIRVATTTVAGVYITGSVAPCMSFYDCTIEGNSGHAMVVDCGILLRFYGGHFEGNCRALSDGEGGYLDDADILIGKSGIPSYASFYGTDFGALHANQVTGKRIRLTGTEVTLGMYGVFINSSQQIDGGGFSTASRIFFHGMTRVPQVVNYPRPNVNLPAPRRGLLAYNPPSLADGESSPIQELTVTGAELGDHVTASFTVNLQGVELIAWVSAANTVSVRFVNRTGDTVDLPNGTITVSVTNQ